MQFLTKKHYYNITHYNLGKLVPRQVMKHQPSGPDIHGP